MVHTLCFSSTFYKYLCILVDVDTCLKRPFSAGRNIGVWRHICTAFALKFFNTFYWCVFSFLYPLRIDGCPQHVSARCICLETSIVISTNPFCAYLIYIASHEMTSFWGILQNSSHALVLLPRFVNISIWVLRSHRKYSFSMHYCLPTLLSIAAISAKARMMLGEIVSSGVMPAIIRLGFLKTISIHSYCKPISMLSYFARESQLQHSLKFLCHLRFAQ